VILIGTLPWSVYWVAALVDAARSAWGKDALEERGRDPRDTAGGTPALLQFILIWIFAVVIFFSIAQSKLPGYILPALPACALLTAVYLERKRGEKPNFALLTLHSALLAALVAGVLLVPYAMAKAANAPRVTAGVLAAIVFIGVAWTVYRRGLRMLRFATLAPMVVLLAFVLRMAAPVLDPKLSYQQAAAALDAIDNRGSTVAIYKVRREAGYGFAYYRGQPVSWYDATYFDQPSGVPSGDHMVIAPAGMEEEIAARAGGRRVSRVGEYAPQKLVFYWVSRNPVHSGQSTVHSDR
jgi:4-amino-4-deoxy-L-arabinose transferase-like glycosyltransferase